MPNRSSVRLDTKCFERSLIKRRDSGFFTFGERCRYIRRLCQRALLPKHTPADTDWSGLLQLQLDGVRQLSSRDFLLRLKLKTDIDRTTEGLSTEGREGVEFQVRPSADDRETGQKHEGNVRQPSPLLHRQHPRVASGRYSPYSPYRERDGCF